MSSLAFPRKSVGLTSSGLAEFYNAITANPAVATEFAAKIETDPRGVLEDIFILKSEQKDKLDRLSDDFLKQRAKILVDQLRSASPRELQIEKFQPNDDQDLWKWLWIFGGVCTLVDE